MLLGVGCGLGAVDKDGYANSREGRVSRRVWRLFNGAIGTSDVCHHCDERSCINPEHLFLGSARTNMVDAAQKGRIAGQRFREEDVREMFRLHRVERLSQKEIARRFSASKGSVSMILRGIQHTYFQP